MSIEATVLTFASSIIGVLLIIIGFFLNKIYVEFRGMGVDITDIKINLQKSADKMELMQSSCTFRHDAIDHKLKDHDRRIGCVEKDLVKLQG